VTIPAAAPSAAPTGLYAEVQQFYARQVHLLDALRAEEFAATFAVDGVFQFSPDAPAITGRTAIAAAMRGAAERRAAAAPVRQRHWFSMLDTRQQSDGTVRTDLYGLIVTSRPGEMVPVIAPSFMVRDTLIREDGELRTLEREVIADQLSS
jgi:actinorhodin biosynthesis protein ActVIA